MGEDGDILTLKQSGCGNMLIFIKKPEDMKDKDQAP
jgi:hypothetical protein